MKLMSDSSTLYTPEEGKKFDLTILPLTVTIKGNTYTEFVDMDSQTFLQLVKEGNIPVSSQPPIGKSMEIFDECDDEILMISMADGLSGTYQSMVGAKNTSKNNEKIHVINSKTLCGPHRYLVQNAMKLRNEGKSLQEIMEAVQIGIDHQGSYLIANDFNFLKRGGRLTPLAASIGGLLKIVPIVIQSSDGKRLEKFGVKRTFKAAVHAILDDIENKNIDSNYKFYIAHIGRDEEAIWIKEEIKERFQIDDVEVLILSPAFITQGGPGCLAIQYILK